MSLREEIAELLPWEIHATRIKLGISDEIINTVLDAAVEAVGANYHIMQKEKETTGVKLHNSVVTMNIEAINKLRGES